MSLEGSLPKASGASATSARGSALPPDPSASCARTGLPEPGCRKRGYQSLLARSPLHSSKTFLSVFSLQNHILCICLPVLPAPSQCPRPEGDGEEGRRESGCPGTGVCAPAQAIPAHACRGIWMGGSGKTFTRCSR